MKTNKKGISLVKVEFFVPVDGKKEYYFGSLAAIYDHFTPEQIGCKLESLWNSKIVPGKPKSTKHCVVSKHKVIRKKQKL